MMDYYDRGGHSCDEAIRIVAENLRGEDAFNVGCIVKYVWRAGSKPGESFEKDLAKAADYAYKTCAGKYLERGGNE